MKTLVFISDTHTRLGEIHVPDGDILIHCGDICRSGELDELEQFNANMAALPHRHKLVIAGNHDVALQNSPAEARRRLTAVTYLQDELYVADGLRFWGTPWVPAFNNWSFGLDRNSPAMAAKRAMIPNGLDVLITHSPPHGIRDHNRMFMNVGCELLRARVESAAPRIHAFGHVHEDYGVRRIGETIFLNASIMNFHYEPANRPFVLEL